MSYQAVIRDASNTLVTNTAVGMQISILQSTSTGTAVYVETQTPPTNANGLVSIEIGAGTVVSGTFSAIDWSAGPYFIKTETDPAGGTNFTITGTSQLLSVPYALYAKTAESATETDPVFNASASKNITTTDITNWNDKYNKIISVTRTELDALTPVFGQMVYNSTDGNILFWNGVKWYKLAGNSDCFPQPTTAVAGASQTITTSATSTTLAANTPVEGTGTWIIYNGAVGGSFSDIHSPTATFSGNACTTYGLKWYIATNCGSSIQYTNISFSETTIANAGNDIYSPLQTTVSLNGNTLSTGTGTWSVISGNGGSFSNVNSPTASFTGNNNTKYTLRWTTASSCGNTSTDDVNVYLGTVIGQFRDGGIVFYIDGTGQHGFVCAINDQSSNAQWGCEGTLITGANSPAIGTGAQNTIDIEAGCITTGTAADICANLTLNSFNDWFLPSENELIEMALSKGEIAITAVANGGTALVTIDGNTYYWSSTQGSSVSSRVVNITFSVGNNGLKAENHIVRAVRAF
jgi:hypothetical protein